jgi:hypothetical protein
MMLPFHSTCFSARSSLHPHSEGSEWVWRGNCMAVRKVEARTRAVTPMADAGMLLVQRVSLDAGTYAPQHSTTSRFKDKSVSAAIHVMKCTFVRTFEHPK